MARTVEVAVSASGFFLALANISGAPTTIRKECIESLLGGSDHRVMGTDGMRPYIILALFVLICLTSSFAVAQKKSQSISSRTPKFFAVHILDENWDSLRLGYTSENSWPILQRIYKHTTVVELTSLDIARYDWVKQQIILTADATEALKKRFKIGVNKGLSANFGMPHRAFVVTVDGEPAYGGIFLERASPMAIRYPVIYIDEDKNGLITMEVRPIHSIYELNTSDPTWEILRRDCIHDFFLESGKLVR